jgi:hypothetical protein
MHTQQFIGFFGIPPDNACGVTFPSGNMNVIFNMRVFTQKSVYSVDDEGDFATYLMSNGIDYE